MSARTLIFFGWIIVAAPVAAQVTVFEENFDGAGAPVGWALDDGWILSTSTPSSGSGVNSLQHKGNAAAGAAMPAISLSGAASATLTYLARRTGAYGVDNLIVKGSADGGATFGVILLDAGEAVPAADSKWELLSVELPPELLGSSEVVIRFEGQGLNASSATVRIDDVTLTADVPVEVDPLSLALVAPVGESDVRSFTATNRTPDAVTLSAPVVSGAGFAIDPSESVALAAGASQEYDVTFSAASQGTFEGSVRLDYGSGSAEVALTGTGSGGLLGFGAASGSAVAGAEGVEVPLQLAFSAAAGLQGLQFRVSWSGDVPLSVSGIERGTAIAAPGEWSLSYETASGYVDVLLLGEGAASLAGGTYDDLLSVLFDVGSVASTSTASLTLANVIGALAEPGGSDADLTASADPHVITVEASRAFFEVSASSIDLGVVAAGESATATLTVSNPGANADLDIREITASNPLFSISPATALIEPDGSADFAIAFTPTTTSFGRQTSDITFAHNGESGEDVISITGKGRGGRGDAEGDGTVDALDVVHAIDFVLARLAPDAAQKAAADLFPFPDGDAELDVRDLTVLSQAIVRGRWPDDVDLPMEEAAAGKTESSGIRLSADPALIELSYDVPIRAFQIVLPAREEARVDVGASEVEPFGGIAGSADGGTARSVRGGAAGSLDGGTAGSLDGGTARSADGGTAGSADGGTAGSSDGGVPGSSDVGLAGSVQGGLADAPGGRAGAAFGAAAPTIAFGVRSGVMPAEMQGGGEQDDFAVEHELRVLVYSPDGAAFPPGAMRLVTRGVIGRPRYVTVIGEGRDRLRVDASVWTSSEEALPSTVLPKNPYPNPLRAGVDVLRIDAGASAGGAVVYDVLGRVVRRLAGSGELEWDGSDAAGRTVVAGLYFVRIVEGRGARAHAIQRTHAIQVVR